MSTLRFKPYLRYIILFLIMAYVSQWKTFHLYFTSLGQKQQILTKVNTSPLIELIYNKTGLLLKSYNIIASSKFYAVMIGIPGNPYMLLSTRLDQEFSDSEKEYVILHEVGHYLLNHAVKEAIFFTVLFTIGCLVVRKKSWYSIPVVGIFFGLLYIQFGMYSEYQADRFAVTHITDPQGMITATEKFKNNYFPPLNDYSLFWPILYRSVPYHHRVDMANTEIQSRLLDK